MTDQPTCAARALRPGDIVWVGPDREDGMAVLQEPLHKGERGTGWCLMTDRGGRWYPLEQIELADVPAEWADLARQCVREVDLAGRAMIVTETPTPGCPSEAELRAVRDALAGLDVDSTTTAQSIWDRLLEDRDKWELACSRYISEMHDALGAGADEDVWPPGLTTAEAIARLVRERDHYRRRSGTPPRLDRIGSLFSGAGGLDLAVESVLGGQTVWQIEQDAAARRVLSRHWPDADRSCTDVRHARGLAPVDAVIGGFPCQDLSVAGSRKGLVDGERSALFFVMARIIQEQQPDLVVIENVPALERWREVVEYKLTGYACRWVRWSATSAGAPHLRRRVLVVATRGGPSLPDLDLVVTPKEWAKMQAEDQVNLWATPRASDDRGPGRRERKPIASETLAVQAALWPTPLSVDAKSGRLAADWAECLMGWPVGWTRREGPSLREQAEALVQAPRWPRGRPPKDHEGPWPGGHAWEPPRTRGGPPVRGRPARLRMCGNGVVPQAAAMALRAALATEEVSDE